MRCVLVHHSHLIADRHLLEQLLHIGFSHPVAAVATGFTDRTNISSSVKANLTLFVLKVANPAAAHRVISPWCHHSPAQETSPSRIDDLVVNLPHTQWRFPAFFADRDRVVADRSIGLIDKDAA